MPAERDPGLLPPVILTEKAEWLLTDASRGHASG